MLMLERVKKDNSWKARDTEFNQGPKQERQYFSKFPQPCNGRLIEQQHKLLISLNAIMFCKINVNITFSKRISFLSYLTTPTCDNTLSIIPVLQVQVLHSDQVPGTTSLFTSASSNMILTGADCSSVPSMFAWGGGN